MGKELPRVYLITDRRGCKDILYVVEEALEGGIRMVQLREKDLNGHEIYNLGKRLRALTNRYKALLLINDRLDIMEALDADGIHIGKNSLPLKKVQEQVKKSEAKEGRDYIIGYSAHSVEEVELCAQEGIDYVTYSPILKPNTKKSYEVKELGVSALEAVSNIGIRVYGLGGLGADNICFLRGVYGVALIGYIISSKEPRRATERVIEEVNKVFN